MRAVGRTYYPFGFHPLSHHPAVGQLGPGWPLRLGKFSFAEAGKLLNANHRTVSFNPICTARHRNVGSESRQIGRLRAVGVAPQFDSRGFILEIATEHFRGHSTNLNTRLTRELRRA